MSEICVKSQRCCVYKITCTVDGKSYIGITNDFKRRLNDHFSGAYLEKPRGCPKLYLAIRKHGKESFKGEVLLYGSREYCAEMEPKIIALYNTRGETGYNIAPGGECATFRAIRPTKPNAVKRKPTSGCFKPGNGLKLTDELYERLVKEYKADIRLEDMEWLPISRSHATRTMKRRGCGYTQRWHEATMFKLGQGKILSEEEEIRLVEEYKSGIRLVEMEWLPIAATTANSILRKHRVPTQRRYNQISEEKIKEIRKHLKEGILSWREISVLLGVSRDTVYKYSKCRQ